MRSLRQIFREAIGSVTVVLAERFRVGPFQRRQKIPIRTFEEWKETQPGFLEADLVAYCGFHLAHYQP